MSSFTEARLIPLVTRDKGRCKFKLAEPIRYDVGHLGSGETIYIASGFETDGASIPWFARMFFDSWGDVALPAILHDWMLAYEPSYSKNRCDEIFYEAMLVVGVPKWKADLFYFAVRTRKTRTLK